MKQYLYLIILLVNLSLPAQTFTDIAVESGIDFIADCPQMFGAGGSFFDFNNDGWLDIYLTGGINPDGLYLNNTDGTFTEIGATIGLSATAPYNTMGVITGDIDNDGWRDILVTTWYDEETGCCGDNELLGTRNLLFRNIAGTALEEIGLSAGLTDSAWSLSASFGDYNKDGWLDIYIGNYVHLTDLGGDGFSYQGYPNNLYLNNGDNTFTDVAPLLDIADLGCTLSTVFTDYDLDNDVDLYVANDFGPWVEPNILYQNNYPDGFTDLSAASNSNVAMFSMGIAIGDYDEDGDFDYYVTNMGNNILYQNNNDGTFSEATEAAGVVNGLVDSLEATGWGTAFFDADNDTYLDLFVCNGYMVSDMPNSTLDPNKLYRNLGDATFADISASAGIDDVDFGRGFAFGDIDNDGDNDLLVVPLIDSSADINESLSALMFGDKVHLYRNDSDDLGNYLKVSLRGTMNSYDAYGSKVRVVSNGRSFIREIDGGSSHASHNSTIAHFGLGNYTSIDTVEVTWLGGAKQVLTDVAINQHITILETINTSSTPDAINTPTISLTIKQNPCYTTCGITYEIHQSTTNPISLTIYDNQGRIVENLRPEDITKGSYNISWTPKTPLTSTIYYVLLQSGKYKISKKMVVIR